MTLMFSMLYYLRKNFLPRESTIAVVGANWGSHVIEISKLWPQSTLYAFEPNPRVYPASMKISLKSPSITQ
ncbi:MAG TPA: hypothetical protein DCE71_08220 [Parachlamydiales bacterium]|nr:hypothetical protein [Parachlamydiales bacterium]